MSRVRSGHAGTGSIWASPSGSRWATVDRSCPFWALLAPRTENPVLSRPWLWSIVRLRLRKVGPRKSPRSGTGPTRLFI